MQIPRFQSAFPSSNTLVSFYAVFALQHKAKSSKERKGKEGEEEGGALLEQRSSVEQ